MTTEALSHHRHHVEPEVGRFPYQVLEPFLIDRLDLAVDGGYSVSAARVIVCDGHLTEDAARFQRLDHTIVDLDVDLAFENDVHLLGVRTAAEHHFARCYLARLRRILEDLEYVH